MVTQTPEAGSAVCFQRMAPPTTPRCEITPAALYCMAINERTTGAAVLSAGRPSSYKPDMAEKARRYIANHEDFDDPVPTVAGLACVLGVVRDTCYAWAKDADKPEFSDILGELAQKQERVLIARGLVGDFNAPITKMMLTKHGYSDKLESDHTSSDGSMTPKPAVDLTKAPPELLEWIVSQGDEAQPE